MPSPNQLKEYIPDSYYHIYNRGLNSRRIFHKTRDYLAFLHYLEITLLPADVLERRLFELKNNKQTGQSSKVYEAQVRQLENAVNKETRYKLAHNIDMLSYCLMPNHFHLHLYQREHKAIEKLMRQLASAYTSYYRRVQSYRGPLFESRYKAHRFAYDPTLHALITGRYIERNPLSVVQSVPGDIASQILNYPYSSLKSYRNGSDGKPQWLKTRRIKKIFSRIKKKPKGDIEERISSYNSYVDYVLSDESFSLEELKEFHLSQVY